MSAKPLLSQTAESVPSTVPSRVITAIDDSRLVQMKGNVHPMARSEFDRGPVESQLLMERVMLVLKRSPAQEAALEKFMEEQNDPKSANFHHWLKPEEFGALYGPSDSDILSITSWLQNQGLAVSQVSKGRTFVEFSGTAAVVQRVFRTEIHRFQVQGVMHIANSTDPSIPEALAPVVEGILSLNDFFAKPMHHELGNFKRNPLNGKWISEDQSVGTRPLYTTSTGSGPFELVSPYDFATIYNVLPLWNAGIDGTNQTIAIAGRSDVKVTDVRAFRTAFGLPAKDPVTIVNGADPGIPSAGDVVENTLDVEWSGAVAKNATIKYVTTKSTATSDGASASVLYIIDNNVAPVMSFSYGNCELAYGTAGNAANNSMWQQAAAQGITAFVASGDQAAAACDGGQQAPYGAERGLAVSGASTTPYNVAVGGTDLNWANSTTSYWTTTNASNGLSAKSYMPEVPWNGSCASNAVDELLGGTANGWDAETTCQQILNLYESEGPSFFTQFVNVVGGTGGKSACTTPSGTTPASCSGGYAKPSWQTGTGVPADGKRDVPDVSLFASGGSLNTAYAICDTAQGPCTYSNSSNALMQAVGGTSVASPAMAGIMALVNQKMGSAQGNANVAFYKLAAQDNRAACASTTVAAGNACNFYDITTDNIAAPCIPGDLNCTLHHSGDQVGILTGYTSTAGYDYATGLGSVNAKNLVNNWASVTGGKAVSVTPASLSFGSTVVGATSAAQLVTIKNTGTSTVTFGTISFTGNSATSFLKSATTCAATLATGASCTISIEFKPAATGTRTASLSIADDATGSPQLVALTGAATAAASTVTVTPASLAFGPTVVGATSAAQLVTIKNTGTSTVTFGTISFTGNSATSFLKSATTCAATLATGASCTISVEFKPTATGNRTASLSIADNATGSPQLVALTGTATAAAPTVTVSPASLAFGPTVVGATSAAQLVTIKNTGTSTVTFGTIGFTGNSATAFLKSATTCAATLATGANCTISVEFKPAATGTRTASLSIADNATGSPQLVALTGAATAAPPTLTVTPASLTFGPTTVGATSAAQLVTIKNTGTSTVTFGTIGFTGNSATAFLKSATTCAATLATGASCTISVEFKPTAAGNRTASLSIADNATGSPQLVALKGTATTP